MHNLIKKTDLFKTVSIVHILFTIPNDKHDLDLNYLLFAIFALHLSVYFCYHNFGEDF